MRTPTGVRPDDLGVTMPALPMPRAALATVVALAAPLLLAGCSSQPTTGEAITVAASDTACTLSSTSTAAGAVAFKVTNSGQQVTEFYVYDEAGTRIVSEVENITPGLTRELVVELPGGTYTTACVPGGTGDGLRAAFTVTGVAASASGATAAGADRRGRRLPRVRRHRVGRAARRHPGVRRRGQGRRPRRGEGALPAGARALGAHRAGRRGLRRARPEARRARERRRARHGVDRLAPHREGAVDRRGPRTAWRRTPTSCSPTPRSSSR